MSRYDVYANPEASERRHTPYLIDVQNDYIDALSTRVVIPLRREQSFGPRARNLNPTFVVKSDNVVLDMARELGMNLSQTVDTLLAQEVQRRYWERWNEQNKDAIAAYNERIEREGLPLAKYRTFAKGR